MKKTILTFGLIAGAILSCFMALAIAFRNEIGFDRGEVLGYTSMVVAFGELKKPSGWLVLPHGGRLTGGITSNLPDWCVLS